MPFAPSCGCCQVVEEDVMAAPKRRGKTISDYEKWEVQQLINSGEGSGGVLTWRWCCAGGCADLVWVR